MTKTQRPYRIEVPGKRTRTATTLHRAEVAMGQMMTEKDVIGRITCNGETVVVAKGTLLGWTKLDEREWRTEYEVARRRGADHNKAVRDADWLVAHPNYEVVWQMNG